MDAYNLVQSERSELGEGLLSLVRWTRGSSDVKLCCHECEVLHHVKLLRGMMHVHPQDDGGLME